MDESRFPRNKLLLYGFLTVFGVGLVLFGVNALSEHALTQIVESDEALRTYIRTHLVLSVLAFSIVYILFATVSLPLESALSIAAGYYFGSVLGVVISVFSATIGATFIFLLIKTYFHDWFHAHVRSPVIVKITEGINRDAFSYVLFLRIVSVFPHFFVNTAFGLSNVRTRDYIFATFIGIIPVTTVFVLAGTQLGAIRRTGNVFTLETGGIILLLGVFSLAPLLWRYLAQRKDSNESSVS